MKKYNHLYGIQVKHSIETSNMLGVSVQTVVDIVTSNNCENERKKIPFRVYCAVHYIMG